MPVINFSAVNQTYRLLMANGLTYEVPRFQRDYSWSTEEWDDLWSDIENTLANPEGPGHYMGYLVLQSNDGKRFIIIDGQQRLTTLSIIILAIIKRLEELASEDIEPDANRRRADQFRNQFIGTIDPVTLLARPKLLLNRNCNHYYQQYLVTLRELPKYRLKPTEHLMRKAFEWFYDMVKGRYHDGADLARFVEGMSDSLFFTIIQVSDELNAYKVFETLNARGVRLSSTDLLKNYLFSVVSSASESEEELNHLDERWDNVVSQLGSEKFPDYVRTWWNSRDRLVRHSELYKRLRDKYTNREGVFELLRHLEDNLQPYLALKDPQHEMWRENPDAKQAIQELSLFGIRQAFPFLLAAHRRLPPEDFTSLLRYVSVISFRYNVVGKRPTNEAEKVYNQVAVSLSQDASPSLRQVLNSLRSLYPADDQFKSDFTSLSMPTSARNNKIIRYILGSLERQLSGQEIDYESDYYTIEHIFPQNPSGAWPDDLVNQLSDHTYRLGNLTLIERNLNRQAANDSFQSKKQIYAQSQLQLNQQLAQAFSEWSPQAIDRRQSQLANIATSIWKISQLSQG